MKTSVTVFLPGLLPKTLLDKHNPLAKRPLKALATLLSKATQDAGPATPDKAIKSFFQGLGMGAVPCGPLGALAHGFISKEENSAWCQVSPIHCLIDQKAVYMLGNQHLEVLQVEANSLLFQLNELLQQDGILLKPASNTDWFCLVPHHQDVVMNDLVEVLHKNMAFLLPSGPDEVYWRRLLTECQMILLSHPVNQQRQQQNKPLISSLWFWGLGRLPQKVSTTFTQVYSRSAVVKGLAILSEISALETPTVLTSNFLIDNHSLIVDDELYLLFQYRDDLKWFELLKNREEQWFYPLLEMLKNGSLESVKIVLGDNREFVITNKQLKYFWRRLKPLESFVLT